MVTTADLRSSIRCRSRPSTTSSREQINSIVTEDRKHPDLIRLHIGYSSMEKALFFTRSDAEAIIKLAKEKNPAIRVLDYEAAPKQASKKRKKK